MRSFEEEFTYAFGGSSIVRGLEGSYLSQSGERIADRINLLYSDAPLALSTNFDSGLAGEWPLFVVAWAEPLKHAFGGTLSRDLVSNEEGLGLQE
jgi:hypothetical protein